MAPDAGRQVSLDWLRGFAVLLVVGFHAFPNQLPSGFIGVDLFFVLSGFLVTKALLRRNPADALVRRDFWIRRTRRLAPAMYVALVGGTILSLALAPQSPARLSTQLLGALTWTSNWQYVFGDASYFARFDPPWWLHLWSVGVEAQFYLAWPLILAATISLCRRGSLVSSGRAVAVVAGALGFCSALAFVVAAGQGGDPSALYMNTFTHLGGVFAGACCAALLSLRRERLLNPGARRSELILAAGMTALLSIAILLPDDPANLPLAVIGSTAVAALTVGFAALFPEPSGRRALGWLDWLGRRSYAVYLWHWPILLTLQGLWVQLTPVGISRLQLQQAALPSITIGVLTMVITCAIAELSWRYVEAPVLEFGWRGAFNRLRAWVCDSPTGSRRLLIAMGIVAVLAVLMISAISLSPSQTTLEQQLGYPR